MNFRNYDSVNDSVKKNYMNARFMQNLNYVQRMRDTFSKPSFFLPYNLILEKLNNFIDLSDPDCNLPNIQHAFQSAEKAWDDGKPDWFVLGVFIHDFGKLLYLQDNDNRGQSLKNQWGIVGDTFVIGCKIPDSVVFPEFNELIDQYSELGIYEEGCGLDNVFVSYGHDEYLYQVLNSNQNKNTLPKEILYCIRYHSLYLHHRERAYNNLLNDYDREMIVLLQDFNGYDLYTKSKETYNLEEIGKKYLELWRKYFRLEGLYL